MPIHTQQMYDPRLRYTWQLGHGRTLELGERTLLMGIVNLTPDSFSDGGQFATVQQAVDHALRLLDEGADIIDLGAESTRPGVDLAQTSQEEQLALAPVIDGILRLRPSALLSIDTYHASTARFAVQAGAAIVNDVSGLIWDREMASTCAALECGLVLMHTRGKPAEWATQVTLRPDAVLPLVHEGLAQCLQITAQHGIAVERVVLDPGFGFGKRGAENAVLLAGMRELHALQRPLLIGLSRKGFLAPQVDARNRVAATVAANAVAILQGAHLLRIHDVAEAKQAAAYIDSLLP